jgi:hypothetical protein
LLFLWVDVFSRCSSIYFTIKIPGFLDDPNIGDPDLLQSCCGEETTKAPTNDDYTDLFVQRGAGEARLNVRIQIVAFVLTRDFLILAVAVRAQPLITFLHVLLA